MGSYILTRHAEKRLMERNIPEPGNRILRSPSRRIKKLIREACNKNGFQNEWGSKIVYFISNSYVYVCEHTDIDTFKVITAFILSEKSDKSAHT